MQLCVGGVKTLTAAVLAAHLSVRVVRVRWQKSKSRVLKKVLTKIANQNKVCVGGVKRLTPALLAAHLCSELLSKIYPKTSMKAKMMRMLLC